MRSPRFGTFDFFVRRVRSGLASRGKTSLEDPYRIMTLCPHPPWGVEINMPILAVFCRSSEPPDILIAIYAYSAIFGSVCEKDTNSIATVSYMSDITISPIYVLSLVILLFSYVLILPADLIIHLLKLSLSRVCAGLAGSFVPPA